MGSMGRSLAVAILFISLAPGLLASPARLDASLGFGGYVVPGRWAPLWIGREGGPDFASALVIRMGAEGRELGRESFPLPAGSRIECPVLAQSELESVTVRLLAGDRILAEARLDARAKVFPGNLVLACGLPARPRLAIASALLPYEPLLALALDPADLPSNGLDYDGVSAVAMLDEGPSLSPAQVEALRAWIASGGRLALCSTQPAGRSLLDSLPLAPLPLAPLPLAPLPLAADAGRADGAATPLGLGAIVRITREISGLPAETAGKFWRETLALAPYGSSPRIGGGEAGRWPGPEGGDAVSGQARAALVAAVAAWLGAVLCAAAFVRPRRGRARAVGALALVAAAAIGLVLAGRPSMDRSLARGSSIRVRALVLPDSGSAIVTASVSRRAAAGPFAWAEPGARLALPIAYSVLESRSGAEWRHGLPRALLSPRAQAEEDYVLTAVLALRSLAGPSFPEGELSARPHGAAPPELASSEPLAFLGPGDAPQGAAWSEKKPGGAWLRLEAAPNWLEGEAPWLLGLREGRPSLAFLVGKGAAPAMDLLVGGAPIRELCWVLPIPISGAEGGR